MLLARDMARLLGNIAFLGMWKGHFTESEAIFTALQADSPLRVGAPLGLALSRIHQGKFTEAIRLLQEKVLPLDPQDAHTRCWLGLALFMGGQLRQAREVLEAVAAEQGSPDAAALSASVLADMNARLQ